MMSFFCVKTWVARDSLNSKLDSLNPLLDSFNSLWDSFLVS